MEIAIIGGGISGLAIAHELVKRGKDVAVLEAQDRVGGTIHSFREDGFITEAGPNGFLDNEPATRALVEEVGLTPKLRPAEPAVKRRFVFASGALHELAMGPAFFTSGVMPLWGKLRIPLEVFTSRPKKAEDETVSSFMRRHIGASATETLIDAMQSGIYAGDPNRLSLPAVFPKLAEFERDHRSLIVGMVKARRKGERKAPTAGGLCSFEGGLETLPRALGERLGARVRRGVEVKGISREGGKWRLATGGEPVAADKLVIAIPSYAAAGLLRPLDAQLAGELEGIEYASVSVVHLGFKNGRAAGLQGFGFLVPEKEHRKILGSIFVSSIFPWRASGGALLTVMVGGARHRELASLPDAELLASVRAELAAIAGVDDAPAFQQIVRWDRAIPQYNVGHLARLDRLQKRLDQVEGLHLSGNAYRGIGLNDCVRNAGALAARLGA